MIGDFFRFLISNYDWIIFWISCILIFFGVMWVGEQWAFFRNGKGSNSMISMIEVQNKLELKLKQRMEAKAAALAAVDISIDNSPTVLTQVADKQFNQLNESDIKGLIEQNPGIIDYVTSIKTGHVTSGDTLKELEYAPRDKPDESSNN